MTVREVVRRLRAWEAGQPVARYDTLHHEVVDPERAFLVAFVRMAGESRPWGIAFGSRDRAPTIRTVPDGRDRDEVAKIAADFGEALLTCLRVHNWTYDPMPKDAGTGELRQVWVPNGQHLAMFHQLAYAYAQTKFGGQDRELLNALGRLSGWIFRESSRRGQQTVMDASAGLREAFSIPAQDARQAHLGYLLAWLQTPGAMADRLAAAMQAEAEPVSPTMSPDLERSGLEPLVERRRGLLRYGSSSVDLDAQIARVLAEELRRRWMLCATAYDTLAECGRDVNAGVGELVRQSISEFWFQHQRIELNLGDPSLGPAFVAHPETDFHGSAAASRYLTYAAADEAYVNQLIHDDPELFREALSEGRALLGTVVHVRDDGAGRSTRPVWVMRIDSERPQRLREGGRVTPYGSAKHEAEVRAVEYGEDGLTAVLEWVTRKTMAIDSGPGLAPSDVGWAGEEVSFVASDAASLTQRRGQRIWKVRDGPGAWLTHGSAPASLAVDIATDQPETIVDDITQLEALP